MNKYKIALQELGRIAEEGGNECVTQIALSHWWEIRRKAEFSGAGSAWRMVGKQVKMIWTTLHMQEQIEQAQSGETLQ